MTEKMIELFMSSYLKIIKTIYFALKPLNFQTIVKNAQTLTIKADVCADVYT